MPTYIYNCSTCDLDTEHILSISQLDSFISPCEVCGEPTKRVIRAPMIMKASVPDGTKREGFLELKEAARLEVTKATMDPRSQEYSDIGKEIQNLKTLKK